MKVKLYTDGSAKGNPNGPGGYGAILQYIDSKGNLHEMELSEGYKKTTNNRMELLAVIKGLEKIKFPCEVEIFSDSAYVINAFNNGWIDDWIENDFRIGKKDEVKNIDLWLKLIELTLIHEITWIKVKGHSGNELNERCDRLATNAAGSSDLKDDVVNVITHI